MAASCLTRRDAIRPGLNHVPLINVDDLRAVACDPAIRAAAAAYARRFFPRAGGLGRAA